jgi:molecular chaperone DnaK
LSLGIETLGGIATRLIERNTTIPTRKSQIFSTAADNQTSVEIHVVQGEREMAAYNTSLGKFHLMGIPPSPRGVPQIEVTFDIDANGIMNVSAKDLGTGKEQRITITASTKLSKDEIGRMVAEAEKFAEADKKQKEKVEMINQADTLIYTSEKTVTELGEKVTGEEKEKIRKAVEELRSVMGGDDTSTIKAKMDALMKEMYEISSRIYQTGAAQQKSEGQQESKSGDEGGKGDGKGYMDADFHIVDDK